MVYSYASMAINTKMCQSSYKKTELTVINIKNRQNEKIHAIVCYYLYLSTKTEVHKLYFLSLSGLWESKSTIRAPMCRPCWLRDLSLTLMYIQSIACGGPYRKFFLAGRAKGSFISKNYFLTWRFAPHPMTFYLFLLFLIGVPRIEILVPPLRFSNRF